VNISLRKFQAGFTLVEVLMSMSCGSLLLAAVITSGVALQRSFAAVEGYAVAEGDQLRVLDYIALDCRRALTASVASNTLSLTVPVYYDGSGNVRTPVLTNGTLSYGSGSVTINYSQGGSNFTRQVVVKDSGGNVTSSTTTAIAKNVSSFTVSPQDLTSSVSCSITFSPSFTYLPGPGPIAGTTVYSNTFLRNASARQ
jgi:prepilin-type N-terminal cleavage/methylation domain-containing protein